MSPTFQRPQVLPGMGTLGPGGTAPFNPNAETPHFSGWGAGIRNQVAADPSLLGGGGDGPPPMRRLFSPEQTMPAPLATSAGVTDLATEAPTRPAAAPPITGFNWPEEPRRMATTPAPVARGGLPELAPMGKFAPLDLPEGDTRLSAPITAPSPAPPAMDRGGVPLPQLPGRKGDPYMADEYDRAKYDAVMAHAKRDESGNVTDRFGRSGKSIFRNALIEGARAYARNPQGGLGAVAGGALGGGLGATFNAQAGYENEFEAGPGRKMQEQEARATSQAAQRADAERAQLQNEHLRQQTDALKRGKARDRYVTLPGGGLFDAESGSFVRDPNEPQARAAAPHWVPVTGPNGQPMYVDLNAPESRGQAYRPYEKPANVAGRLINVSPGGAVFDPESKTAVYQNPASRGSGYGGRGAGSAGSGIPAEARTEYNRIQRLKAKADSAWAAAKKELDPDKKAALEAQARAALDDYNANAEDFGNAYGDFFETGAGREGWNYVKPKPVAPASSAATAAAPKATVGPEFVQHVAAQLGLTPEQARQRIEAAGYQIR